MSEKHRLTFWLPIYALSFSVAHLAFEYFNGGVQSHHLLQRADMPSISNWLGLLVLPVLGIALALRIRTHPDSAGFDGIPRPILAAFCGALVYGTVLAAAFELHATSAASVAFFGLFACALVWPVYRAEYTLGFVVGMTFTFGSVLPLLIALLIGTVSAVVRYCARAVAAMVRRTRTPGGGRDSRKR